MATTTSTRSWSDRYYQSLPISWYTRWRLVRTARTDRLAGVPVGLGVATTPVLRELLARRDETCEHERTRYYAAVRQIDVRLAEIGQELLALHRQLAGCDADLARTAVPPTEKMLTDRRAGEQGLAPELVRQRRSGEHGRRAETARQVKAQVQQRLDDLLAEEAHLQARSQNRADVARSRVLRFAEHADRLAAVYRRALIRRHPQREALITAWEKDLFPAPAWVSRDELVPSHRTSGASA